MTQAMPHSIAGNYLDDVLPALVKLLGAEAELDDCVLASVSGRGKPRTWGYVPPLSAGAEGATHQKLERGCVIQATNISSLLHEVAHALARDMAEPHGPLFAAACARIAAVLDMPEPEMEELPYWPRDLPKISIALLRAAALGVTVVD